MEIYTNLSPTQLEAAVSLGVLSPEYERSWSEDGMVREYSHFPASRGRFTTRTECAGCHQSYFTPNHIALCPSYPVLEYLVTYLLQTKAIDRKPLFEVRLNL